MAKWKRQRMRLKKDHGWTAEPGCQVFVADRGAVRFDFPRGWVIEPGENGSIKVQDKKTPDDDCCLQMTVFYLRDEIDWSGLPVSKLVREITHMGEEKDEPPLEQLPLHELTRDGMDLAWTGKRYLDPGEDREACSRTMIARKWNIQPIITYAYWADDAPRVARMWDILLKTLVLGDYIEDPTQRVS